jgi:hypothetical protein
MIDLSLFRNPRFTASASVAIAFFALLGSAAPWAWP